MASVATKTKVRKVVASKRKRGIGSVTAEDFWAMGTEVRGELIYGEVVEMSPAGLDHSEVALRIGSYLREYCDHEDFGRVYGEAAGFMLSRAPDMVRSPDVAVVMSSRLDGRNTRGFLNGPPDLAVEVVSPNDTKRAVMEKVNMWLAHGTKAVWVADPSDMTLVIHRVGAKPVRLTSDETLKGDPELKGFKLPLKKVFRKP